MWPAAAGLQVAILTRPKSLRQQDHCWGVHWQASQKRTKHHTVLFAQHMPTWSGLVVALQVSLPLLLCAEVGQTPTTQGSQCTQSGPATI